MATLRNFCVRASALVMAGMLVMAPGAAADPAVVKLAQDAFGYRPAKSA